MNFLLLVYVPIVVSIIWASMRVGKNNGKEAILVAFVGTIIVVNGLIKHFALMGCNLSNLVVFIQQFISSLIIPCTYAYFSRQVGRRTLNSTSILLLSLLSFLVFPNIVVFLDNTRMIGHVGYMSFLIVGRECHTYTIADFIVVMQSMVTAIRVFPLYKTIKKYGLSLSMDVKRFMTWWCIAIVFVAFASYNSERGEYNYVVDIVCRIGFMLIVTRAFYKIGSGFDLRPIIEEEKEHVELSEFVSISRCLSERLSAIIKRGDILSHGYSVDDAVSELGTNRTYLFRMVKAEFGCTFSELLNKERVNAVKKMLIESDEPLSSIAEKCGFNAQSYMAKVFKKLEGVTPTEFREGKS